MNPLLQNYISRFQTDQKNNPPKEFYSQLSLEDYHQKLPYLFGIENFCLRLFLALKNDHKICIYSDYDTDAVTATATMYWSLINLGFKKENLKTYAPDRFTEGYGMNPLAVEKLSREYDLIISVDCGINSVKEAEIVKNSSECDLIITDHHHLHNQLPEALAVVNPRLAKYYNQNLNLSPEIQNDLFFPSLYEKQISWVQKVKRDPTEFSRNSAIFLSESVTGVGVAWFCALWLAYFLEELDSESSI